MDLFGIKEHDAKHDAMEQQLRRLVEQVAQLTINLGATRTDLRRLALEVEGKVSSADVDPAVAALNEGVKEARVKLAAAREAAEADWAALSEELSQAIEKLRKELEAAEQ